MAKGTRSTRARVFASSVLPLPEGPTICDGDIVCIRRQPEVEQGEIAAVRIGEEATLKHFHRQGETVMLLADNTAVCPPMVFAGPQLEEIQIEGRAVGFCRGL